MKRRNVRPCLEVLEDRVVPAFSATWSAPRDGIWNNASNWTTNDGQSWYPGDAQHETASATFDGGQSNASPTSTPDGQTLIQSLSITGGYSGIIHIGNSSGNTASIGVSSTLTATTAVTFDYNNANAALAVGNNATFTTVTFQSATLGTGQYEQAGGTLSHTGSIDSQGEIWIQPGATWDVTQMSSSSQVTLHSSQILIDADSGVGSTLFGYLLTPSFSGTWLKGSVGGTHEYLLNAGKMSYRGTSASGVQTEQDIPILNKGQLYIDAGPSTNNAYKVVGALSETNNYSIKNAGGTVNSNIKNGVYLANGPFLRVDSGLTQVTSAEIRIVDAVTAAITVTGGAGNKVDIESGSISMGESLDGQTHVYGKLAINGDCTIVNATVYAKVKANDPNVCDLLQVNANNGVGGTLSLGVFSTLYIQPQGAVFTPNASWTVVKTPDVAMDSLFWSINFSGTTTFTQDWLDATTKKAIVAKD
jgi:hypothetical protein